VRHAGAAEWAEGTKKRVKIGKRLEYVSLEVEKEGSSSGLRWVEPGTSETTPVTFIRFGIIPPVRADCILVREKANAPTRHHYTKSPH
jgi:hypothetical protein